MRERHLCPRCWADWVDRDEAMCRMCVADYERVASRPRGANKPNEIPVDEWYGPTEVDLLNSDLGTMHYTQEPQPSDMPWGFHAVKMSE